MGEVVARHAKGMDCSEWCIRLVVPLVTNHCKNMSSVIMWLCSMWKVVLILILFCTDLHYANVSQNADEIVSANGSPPTNLRTPNQNIIINKYQKPNCYHGDTVTLQVSTKINHLIGLSQSTFLTSTIRKLFQNLDINTLNVELKQLMMVEVHISCS